MIYGHRTYPDDGTPVYHSALCGIDDRNINKLKI